jgi:hypothetical protein
MDHIYEVEAACGSCDATGIYVGFAEKDGAGVQCRTCGGKGKRTLRLEWNDFKGRKERDGIRRVYQFNPGMVIGEGRAKDNAVFTLVGFGGMTYAEWLAGKPFPRGSEMRRYSCPAWWYQSVDYEKKPQWEECGFGTFSSCPSFGKKDACWRRWDKENPE